METDASSCIQREEWAMSKTITADELGKAIQDVVEEYAKDVKKVVDESLPKAAKKGVKVAKKKSPTKTGEYAKGWTSKVEKERLGTKVTIYNKKRPQLTHLLEKGHANRDGGRTKAYPHIKPAEEEAVKEALKLIEEGVKQ